MYHHVCFECESEDGLSGCWYMSNRGQKLFKAVVFVCTWGHSQRGAITQSTSDHCSCAQTCQYSPLRWRRLDEGMKLTEPNEWRTEWMQINSMVKAKLCHFCTISATKQNLKNNCGFQTDFLNSPHLQLVSQTYSPVMLFWVSRVCLHFLDKLVYKWLSYSLHIKLG